MTRRTASFVALAALATLCTAATALPRLLAGGNGSLTGTITTASGTPAAACPIKFFAPINWEGEVGGAGKKSTGDGSDLGTREPTLLQGKGTVAAKATTDEKGKFAVKSLKPGVYRFIAGSRAMGLQGGEVTIEADKAATVEVKLTAPAPR